MAQGQGTEWVVQDFERLRGDFPIRTFLGSLDGRNANDAAALLILLKARGNQLREPRSKFVADNLFELRGHQIRMFYMFQPGRQIVLLEGVIKKQDKLEPEDVKRVKQYQQEVDRRGPRAPAK